MIGRIRKGRTLQRDARGSRDGVEHDARKRSQRGLDENDGVDEEAHHGCVAVGQVEDELLHEVMRRLPHRGGRADEQREIDRRDQLLLHKDLQLHGEPKEAANRSSIVWTEHESIVPSLRALAERDFVSELSRRFGPFLGDINKDIRLKRLETPRVKVPKGSVGLTEQFCNIYTYESPGGWNIIGNTPLEIFNKKKQNDPLLINPGDKVKFKHITQKEYDKTKR